MTRLTPLVVLATLGCSAAPADDTDTGGDALHRCRTSADCDDGIACTVDTCAAGNVCEHQPMDALCDDGESCVVGRGCVLGACTTSTDCDDLYNFCDGIPRCDPEFGCRPPTTPRVCDDSDDCTTNACDRDLGRCVFEYDCSADGCAAANPSCLWHGCFDIDPPIAQRCALGYVNYNFGRVCFELRGPSLAVLPNPAGTLTDPLAMAPAPTTADFDAVLEISGGCIETYRLAGTMTDGDHFDALWTATYTDHDGYSCRASGCMAQSISVHGTRVP
ncbi:MAG: hypothetical protein GYA57_01395 [Myxococcales bacterium]|nr:hypothetical protein [Myxococcales bacterium]